jgi:glycosyltransferase involved in cell wall biosynthesis
MVMSFPRVSIIIPTHNRHEQLGKTLAGLRCQDLSPENYEIIVVDDGSCPPVTLPDERNGVFHKLVRLPGVERSAARNAGAEVATENILVFLDDDISVAPTFLKSHLRGHEVWPGALITGGIQLPEAVMQSPFARFRQQLENSNLPPSEGVVPNDNFCAAGNMSIRREDFFAVGGFDVSLSSSEDQDLALRYTARGGTLVFLPEAAGLHFDRALDIRGYCRRMEWGYEQMVPFCRRYPDRSDNIERQRVNGPLDWKADGVRGALRKMLKKVLGLSPFTAAMFGLCSVVEKLAPRSRLLDRLYRLALGVHIFRGFRKGLRRYADSELTTGHSPNVLGPRQVTETK